MQKTEITGQKELSDEHALFVNLYREGRLTEADEWANDCLSRSRTPTDQLAWRTRRALVAHVRGNILEALSINLGSVPLLTECRDDLTKANFHNELALTYRALAGQGSPGYYDLALVEYEAARYHYELAGNDRFLGGVENNIAFLLITVGRTAEAHGHLERAREIFRQLSEWARVAEIDDTRAKAYLADGDYSKAERCGGLALGALADTDEVTAWGEARATTLKAILLSDPDLLTRPLVESVKRQGYRKAVNEEVHRIESAVLRVVLDEAGGSVKRAAEVLGMTRQGLDDKLKNFPELKGAK